MLLDNRQNKDSSANKIQARREESANFENGVKLIQLAAELLLRKPKDEEAAKALAALAKERFMRAFNRESARGASFEAAISANNAASAIAIISENFDEELDMLEMVAAKLKESVPRVESGEIEFGAFGSVVNKVNTHLYTHFEKNPEHQNKRVLNLMLECNEMLLTLAEQNDDDYGEIAGFIATRGLLRLLACAGCSEDKFVEIHADAVNGFKKLIKQLEDKGQENAGLIAFLRNTVIPDFNQAFRMLKSEANNSGRLEGFMKFIKPTTDPDDPNLGIRIHG